MVKDQNTKGILYIMTGMAFFSIQDSLIKFIYNDIALFELYLIRTIIQASLLLALVLITKRKVSFKTHYPLLTLLRVVCFFFGFSFFYISLTFMTLAMTSALFFSCFLILFRILRRVFPCLFLNLSQPMFPPSLIISSSYL